MGSVNFGPCECCGSSGSASGSSGNCCGLVCVNDTLYATIDSECLGLDGASLPIVCTNGAWQGLTSDGCSAGVFLSISVQCLDGVWTAAIGLAQAGPCNASEELSPISVSCDPFEVVFQFTLPGGCCPCGGDSTVTVTVTR